MKTLGNMLKISLMASLFLTFAFSAGAQNTGSGVGENHYSASKSNAKNGFKRYIDTTVREKSENLTILLQGENGDASTWQDSLAAYDSNAWEGYPYTARIERFHHDNGCGYYDDWNTSMYYGTFWTPCYYGWYGYPMMGWYTWSPWGYGGYMWDPFWGYCWYPWSTSSWYWGPWGWDYYYYSPYYYGYHSGYYNGYYGYNSHLSPWNNAGRGYGYLGAQAGRNATGVTGRTAATSTRRGGVDLGGGMQRGTSAAGMRTSASSYTSRSAYSKPSTLASARNEQTSRRTTPGTSSYGRSTASAAGTSARTSQPGTVTRGTSMPGDNYRSSSYSSPTRSSSSSYSSPSRSSSSSYSSPSRSSSSYSSSSRSSSSSYSGGHSSSHSSYSGGGHSSSSSHSSSHSSGGRR